jgi:acetyltransferase-like isoleucine patch superfamily enzyme
MIKRLHYYLFKWFSPLMVKILRDRAGNKLANTRISNTTYIGNPEKLNCADHVFIGHFNFIDASNGLEIDEGCQITNYVSILTHSSHSSIRLYGRNYHGSEMIGYLKGSVSIGKGDFPDFSIISGNPAKVIGDTREMDEPYLREHPELIQFYSEWANK